MRERYKPFIIALLNITRINSRREEEFLKVERCPWKCPLCENQCGGVKDHRGKHQCPRHYKGEAKD